MKFSSKCGAIVFGGEKEGNYTVLKIPFKIARQRVLVVADRREQGSLRGG